jgi:hypothetical protein
MLSMLQYSEERDTRRYGIRVTAIIDELPAGPDSCCPCPVVITIGGERYRANATLRGGDSPLGSHQP